MNSLNTAERLPSGPQPSGTKRPWYHPLYSPEHGAYVVLLVAFLTGAAAAQQWTGSTGWALLCAFLGFQAEHPLILQIRQRKTLKPRFLFWGGVYAGAASAIALYLYLSTPVIAWLYGSAILVLLVDAISVFYRQQKSILNEWITFAAVCLSAPLAYAATVGTLSPTVMGLWLVNALFFGGSIFTVKLRKLKTLSGVLGIAYHIAALLITIGLYQWQIIPLAGVVAIAISFVKFCGVLWQRDWYCQTPIRNVAMIETTAAFVFLTIVSLSLLPAYLPSSVA